MTRHRNSPPAPEPPKQSYANRLREDAEKQQYVARSWVGNVDWLVQHSRMQQAAPVVVDCCATMVLRGPKSEWWLVQRALDRMAEAGFPVREEFHQSWLKRLRAEDLSEQPMGDAIKDPAPEDFEFPGDRDWRDL